MKLDIEAEMVKYREKLEKLQVMSDYMDAMNRDDEEAMRRILPTIKFHPETLKLLKALQGADFIREEGYNTELADKEYGPDWLDREDI